MRRLLPAIACLLPVIAMAQDAPPPGSMSVPSDPSLCELLAIVFASDVHRDMGQCP